MTRSKADVTIDFDPYTSVRVLDRAHIDTRLSDRCPVAWSEEHGGFWYLTRFDDVKKLATDHKSFSTREGVVLPIPPYSRVAMVYDDPPVHTAYRRALNPTLSEDAIKTRVQPRIEHWTNLHLDRIATAGRCDLMDDIAVPIPAAVTLEWLGFEDEEEWARIGSAWHAIFSRAPGTPVHDEAAATIAWFDTRIAEELEKRQESPREDALTEIGALVIEGEPISREAAVSIARIMVGAGTDTTTSLLGKAFVHLFYNPEDAERLRAEPELWATATDEFLRRYPPTRGLFRTCVKETQIGDLTIEAGDHVLGSILASNLQDSVFEDPLAVDLERTPNRHLSFGVGVHKCIGMHLARAEFVEIMKQVLTRMPDYVLLEDQLVEYARQGNMSGWMTLPTKFTPYPVTKRS